MLQRIQTLYLFIALILMGLMFFFPYAEILSGEGRLYSFQFDGLYYIESLEVYVQTLPTIILLSVIPALSLVTIFLFRRRILQMRIAFINMLLMLGFMGLMYFYIRSFSNELQAEAVSYKIFDIFPAIAAILNYLAIRAIGKDEALVRSVDRIR
jgi:hypothetical protein